MNIFNFLKENLDARDVALKYLGKPAKISANKNYYKSPFREEKDPSFVVNPKYMYDFGSAKYYSIIDFGKTLWNTDVYTTTKILAKDFNIELPENEKMSKQEIEKIKQAQEEKIRRLEQRKNWYNTSFRSLCDENLNLKKKIAGQNIDTLDPKDCDMQNKLERILEIDCQSAGGSYFSLSPEELYTRYGNLDFTKKQNIENYINVIFNDMTKRDFISLEEETESEEL